MTLWRSCVSISVFLDVLHSCTRVHLLQRGAFMTCHRQQMKELGGKNFSSSEGENETNTNTTFCESPRKCRHITNQCNFNYSTLSATFAWFVWPGSWIKINRTGLRKETNNTHSCVSFPDLSHLCYFWRGHTCVYNAEPHHVSIT